MRNQRDSRASIEEMEQIQRGLERFLEKELSGEEDSRSEEEFPGEDWDSGEAVGRRRQQEPEAFSPPPRRVRRPAARSARGSVYDEVRGADWEDRDDRESGGERTDRRGRKGDKARSEKGKPRKKRRRLGFLLRAALIVALVGCIYYYLVGILYTRMRFSPIESLAGTPVKEDGVVNILLIGNDSRENGEDGRSDAMILLSISDRTKQLVMTSLLRDMYVEIPGHKGNRLNAAYSYGGAELLMETVEENLGITVNRYVLVNFEAFAKLVDAVGGVELELTADEIGLVNGYLNEYNELTNRPAGTDYMDTSVSGRVHLNGPQALAYTRNRYIGTDFGRTERQRKVLAEIIRNLPGAAVSNPKGVTEGILPNLTTNLTQPECALLGVSAWKFLTYELVQDSVPVAGTYSNASIRGMAVLEVDFEANRAHLQETLYGR